ncbi:YveK family protein [Glutamicibacter sp. NPDC087344]|uniref:YveK family protein n=1 Tax=Glutamicibacter sp. NPDC087344 TaxID=3363994 RepID=UPI003808AFE1
MSLILSILLPVLRSGFVPMLETNWGSDGARATFFKVWARHLRVGGPALQENKQPMLLADLWRRIAYRWKTVCVVFIVTVFASLAFGVISGTNYSAKTVLTVNPLTTNPFSSATANQQINITTERAILSSGEVARRAAENLGEDVSASSLSENASIEAPQGSQVLTVTVVDSDPERAVNKANALAAAYLEFRAEGASQVANTYIEAIDKRIAAIDQSETGTSASNLVLSDLINQRNDLALVAENPGRIIGFADATDTRMYPGMDVYLVAGVAGGLILGVIAALVRDRLSRSTGNAARLAERTGRKVFEVTDPADLEGVRWIVRAQMGAETRLIGPSRAVGFLSLGRFPESQIRRTFAQVLKSQARHFHSQSIAAVLPEELDRGWPEKSELSLWSSLDAVLTGIPSHVEATRVAMLCDRFLDSIVLLIDQSTSLTAVSRYLEICDGIDESSVFLVFIKRRSKRNEYPSNSEPYDVPIRSKVKVG